MTALGVREKLPELFGEPGRAASLTDPQGGLKRSNGMLQVLPLVSRRKSQQSLAQGPLSVCPI